MNSPGKPHFHLLGIPVRIELTFFVIIPLLGLSEATRYDPATGESPIVPGLLIAWVAICFFSILLHELGHAVAYRRYGHHPSILIYGMGGLTFGARLTPRHDLLVSLAGPLSALLLVGVPALLIGQSDLVSNPDFTAVLGFVIWVNVGWSILNLLPILPLDGGNATVATIKILTGRDGERAARILSIAVAGAIGVWALSLKFTFGAIYAGYFAFTNFSALSKRSGVSKTRALDSQLADMDLADLARSFVSTNDPQTCREIVLTVLNKDQVRNFAIELLSFGSGAGVGPAVGFQALLHNGGRYRDAAGVGDLCYRDGRSPLALTAYNVACSLAQTGANGDAAMWISRALDDGYRDFDQLATDPDLAALRSSPEFSELHGRLNSLR